MHIEYCSISKSFIKNFHTFMQINTKSQFYRNFHQWRYFPQYLYKIEIDTNISINIDILR